MSTPDPTTPAQTEPDAAVPELETATGESTADVVPELETGTGATTADPTAVFAWSGPPDADAAIPVVVEREGYPLLTRIAAEAFGSFALVLVAVGALLYTQLSGAGTLGVALATGLVLAGLTIAFGHVSGAHMTPAVSVGAAIAGRIGAVDAVLYVVAQVLGGVVAVAALLVTVPADLPAGLGSESATAMLAAAANGWGDSSPLFVVSGGAVTFGLAAALVVELLATAVVVAVVLSNRARRSGAVAVGLTFSALLLIAAPVTNGALNPARATAVALVALGSSTTPLTQLWLFWLTGLLGGAIAGLGALAFGRHTTLDEAPDLTSPEWTEDEQTIVLD